MNKPILWIGLSEGPPRAKAGGRGNMRGGTMEILQRRELKWRERGEVAVADCPAIKIKSKRVLTEPLRPLAHLAMSCINIRS